MPARHRRRHDSRHDDLRGDDHRLAADVRARPPTSPSASFWGSMPGACWEAAFSAILLNIPGTPSAAATALERLPAGGERPGRTRAGHGGFGEFLRRALQRALPVPHRAKAGRPGVAVPLGGPLQPGYFSVSPSSARSRPGPGSRDCCRRSSGLPSSPSARIRSWVPRGLPSAIPTCCPACISSPR